MPTAEYTQEERYQDVRTLVTGYAHFDVPEKDIHLYEQAIALCNTEPDTPYWLGEADGGVGKGLYVKSGFSTIQLFDMIDTIKQLS